MASRKRQRPGSERHDKRERPMTIEQLRLVHRATPFRPFTVQINDGRSYHVPQRDYLSMSPGGRTVMVYVNGDAAAILDVSMMTVTTTDTP